jgi:ferredoxin-NADP reductase
MILRVTRVEPVVDGVVSLVLERPDGAALPAWDPGAHLELQLESGRIRHYSLHGDPEDTAAYRVAVLRCPDGAGGSREIHETLAEGAEVVVRGPRNHFPLVDAPRYFFVAGGIGITPVRAMVREAARRGREWTLLYGGRSRGTMAFADELAEEPGGRLVLHPEDESGTPDLASFLAHAEGAVVYCCGPTGMIDATTAVMASLGRTADLHVERFSAPAEPVVTDGEDRPVEVELRASGITVTVPADRSILDVVTEAIPNVLSSCAEGYCGTCETVVLEGVPEHRDTLLSDEDRASNETMLICVSRACTDRLVLDL